MPNITVYVPGEVQEKINKWREQLNLSELARRAIMLEIAKLEEREASLGELGPLIAKLREQKQKAQMQSESYQMGFKTGKKEASRGLFDYAAFRKLPEQPKVWGREPNVPDTYWQMLPESAEELWPDFVAEWKQTHDPFKEYDEEEWLRGVIDGALTVWNEVQDLL